MSAITDEVVKNVWEVLRSQELEPSIRKLTKDGLRAVLEAAVACGVVPNEDQVIVLKDDLLTILTALQLQPASDRNFAWSQNEAAMRAEGKRLLNAMLKATAPKAEGE